MKKKIMLFMLFLTVYAFAQRDIYTEVLEEKDYYYEINENYQLTKNLKMSEVWSWYYFEYDESVYDFDYCEETNTLIFCRTFVKFETKKEVHIFLTYKVHRNKKVLITNTDCEISVMYIFDNIKFTYKGDNAIERLSKDINFKNDDKGV